VKRLKGIVIILLVFGLPAGSYLYLRSGFMYRLHTLEILKNKTELSTFQHQFITEKDDRIFKDFYHGVTLFEHVQNKKDQKDLYFLAESLKSRSDFNLVAISTHDHYSMIDDTLYSQNIHRIKSTKDSIKSFFGDSRFLLARDSFVRKVYGDSHQEMLDVYEHTVVLLPMKKKEKLDLIRTKDTRK
jgi:hypothetical protein